MRAPVPGAKTPLLYATRRGDLAVTQLLVDAGAEIERADADGVTPLLSAILNASVAAARGAPSRTEHLAVARHLVERGANVNSVDWYGETPLWAAVDVRNLELGRDGNDRNVRDEALALLDRLLKAGANPNARTREYPHERRFLVAIGSAAWVDLTGQTPFLRAAAAGDVEVMRLLLAHGADPNIATDAGTTPLMVAAGVNWSVAETYDFGNEALFEAVKLAHSLGNDVNAVNSMGIAAIHGAANRGANDVIEYLAANGARLDVADAQGRTPLDWAEGVFLATHPPVRKPETIALLERLLKEQRGSTQ
jgi:ankyrin repeat protein